MTKVLVMLAAVERYKHFTDATNDNNLTTAGNTNDSKNNSSRNSSRGTSPIPTTGTTGMYISIFYHIHA